MKEEILRQAELVEKAQKYEKEKNKILADNEELHNTVNNLKEDYKNKQINS